MTPSSINCLNGAWSLGDDGARKLTHLSQQLFEKTLNAERSRGFLAEAYLPWQSCPIRSDRVDVREFKTGSDRILRDQHVLRRLRKAYWGGRSFPLGEISIPSKSMTIDVHAEKRDLTCLVRAIHLVTSASGSWETRFNALVKMIVPLKTIGGKVRAGGVGFSSHYAKGAVFLSVPRIPEFCALELSINLAHEIGHQALMIFQSADRIIAGDLGQPVYSGVRKTNRPAIQSFHAMVALTYMVEYTSLRLQASEVLSEKEIHHLKKRQLTLLADLENSIGAFEGLPLTLTGERLLDDARRLLKSVSMEHSAWAT